jgi:predicted SAM-dependent methyltransferase
MINLGCGSRFHLAWMNVDIVPSAPEVTACDLSKPFPFPDGSFDVVYHSNVLEHIRREHAHAFMRECARILKPSGILRVAVPDLERICRLYLENLQAAVNHDHEAEARYDWMMLELLDQTVREHSGGGMLDYLRQVPLPGEDFILERIGNEGRGLLNAIRSQPIPQPVPPAAPVQEKPRSLRQRLSEALCPPQKEQPVPCTAEEVAIGRFRLAGEVHQWMYDRFSLARLMTAVGLDSPQLMTPQTSRIPGWAEYHLEVGPDGAVHKPDSFVMECVKAG